MNKFQIEVIKDAFNNPDTLTEWEYEFINNLAGKENDYELSDKQNKIINRIAQKLI